MSSTDPYLGKVLDEKYRLERQLGRGGMGAVYLATHLGTERYVALKLITPQFMGNREFVARFKREARAAGRLRHPNVVDVTDFGFAHPGGEAVAYLVMEYLDGCTLADVLVEEERLPLEWVVDILEQVCSAVHEAHQQGIVHRDLKPENIWLEPNRLGGYRVKVLDFGIAKLAEGVSEGGNNESVEATHSSSVTGSVDDTNVTLNFAQSRTGPEKSEKATLLYGSHDDDGAVTRLGDADATHAGAEVLEESTQMFGRADETAAGVSADETRAGQNIEDDDRTLMFAERQTGAAQATNLLATTTQGAELTKVGAIMGTPLYMSPEQCAAKNLDARSDIYSIGVIAYQMLAGEPPFAGTTGSVMRDHIKAAPALLRERSKKVPKRAAQVVMRALAKDPSDRPQTAAAFAGELRAQAEGIGSLYRRAFALYSEYFPKFLKLSIIAHLPVIVTTLVMVGLQIAAEAQPPGLGFAKVLIICAIVIFALLQVVSYFVAASAISGMTAVIVTRLVAAPLRPVELRSAFAVLKRRWRPFLNTAFRVTLRIVIGFILLIIPGLIMTIRYALYAPVVLIEGLEKKAAMRRARQLASRSWRTIIIVSLLQFLIPLIFSFLVGRLTLNLNHSSGPQQKVYLQQIAQQLSGLVNIVIVPLMAIVPALLYLKMRQLGGETLTDALAQIEELEDKSSEWQQRMRTRLSLHTPRSTRRASGSSVREADD
ncbi:MAG: protein kinase [Acidobacteriota bacterium]|nr:protein kinase [Acidobacteriota bacterium]